MLAVNLTKEEGIGNYVFIRNIGYGASAIVKLARHRRTGVEVAIKIIDKTKLNKRHITRLQREVRIMKKLHHPNIIQLYEVFETDVTLYLVLEYASGGELYDYLIVHDKMKEKDARPKFLQLLSALQYCHNKRIIHRDIKPENILLDENANIKIADFGFSNNYNPGQLLETACGSPAYAAPELFLGEPYTGPEVDIWSAGIVLYCMTTSCVPFNGRDLAEMKVAVTRCDLVIPSHCSPSLQKLLRRMICVDRNNRKSLNNLLDDEWLNADGDVQQALNNIFRLPAELVEDDTPHAIAVTTPDEAVVAAMINKYHFTHEEILDSLRSNRFDFITSVYRVLWQEQLMKSISESQMSASTPPTSTPPTSTPPTSTSPVPSLRMRRKNFNIKLAEDIITEDIITEEITAIEPTVAKSPIAAQRVEDPLELLHAPKPTRRISPQQIDVPSALLAFNVNDGNKTQVEPVPTSPVASKRNLIDLKRPTSTPPAKIAAFLGIRSGSGSNLPTISPQRSTSSVPSSPTAFRARKFSASSMTPSTCSNSSNSSSSSREGVYSFDLGDRSSASPPVVAAVKPPRPMSVAGNVVKATALISRPQDDSNKPRTLRLFFSKITTSSKSPPEIVAQIINGAKLIDARLETVSAYSFSLITSSCSAEVEICRLPRLTELYGLRFKRRSGSSMDYKRLCDKFIANLNL